MFWSSPRLSSRGRIEAFWAWRLGKEFAVLHGYQAVAALKHERRAKLEGIDQVVLHGYQAVAALKRERFDAEARRMLMFSTATKPWPH